MELLIRITRNLWENPLKTDKIQSHSPRDMSTSSSPSWPWTNTLWYEMLKFKIADVFSRVNK